MDRKEFIERVASKLGADSKEVENVFEKFLDLTTAAFMDGVKVNLGNFGTFSPKITKATRKFSNLLNREIEIPEKFRISFSPSSKLAEEINEKYVNLKTQVIQEASEREIEKKVQIITPEKEEDISKADKLFEEIARFDSEEPEKRDLEEVSLTAELLDVLKGIEEEQTTDVSEKIETDKKIEMIELKETVRSEFQEKKDIKEEVSHMPEMNLNQEKSKFTYGEDLTATSSSREYKPSTPSAATTDAPAFREKGSSTALWVTMIILLLGIIGIGIYWALTSDVTEAKKEEPLITGPKQTTPQVIVEKQPSKLRNKEIIIAPEEFTVLPPETSVKQKTALLTEEPKIETTVEKEQKITPKTQMEVEKPPVTFTPQRTPITKKRVSFSTKTTKTVTTPLRGDYFIQVNSYTEKRFADAFAKDLRKKGYRAFVESAELPDIGKVFRVKVGFYIDEDQASKDYHSLRLLLKREDIYVDRR